MCLLVGTLAASSCGDDDDDDTNPSTTPNNNGSQDTQKPDDNGTTPSTPEKTKTFTVTFNTDGGSEVPAQTVEDGKSATQPVDPTKDGFYFLGWYVGDNVYEFTQLVSNDLTVIALWMKKTEYDVDLGLPSGTIWASCNVGAKNTWDSGDYFAWGETKPKDEYGWDTYKYCGGSGDSQTKYCSDGTCGKDGFTDNLTILLPEDDAATANMGKEWRMPTLADIRELYEKCDWEFTSDSDGTSVSGYVVKSRSNTNSLFLPAAGYNLGSSIGGESRGYYWSSTLNTEVPSLGPKCGFCLGFTSDGVSPDQIYFRSGGYPVRAVRCK